MQLGWLRYIYVALLALFIMALEPECSSCIRLNSKACSAAAIAAVAAVAAAANEAFDSGGFSGCHAMEAAELIG